MPHTKGFFIYAHVGITRMLLMHLWAHIFIVLSQQVIGLNCYVSLLSACRKPNGKKKKDSTLLLSFGKKCLSYYSNRDSFFPTRFYTMTSPAPFYVGGWFPGRRLTLLLCVSSHPVISTVSEERFQWKVNPCLPFNHPGPAKKMRSHDIWASGAPFILPSAFILLPNAPWTIAISRKMYLAATSTLCCVVLIRKMSCSKTILYMRKMY